MMLLGLLGLIRKNERRLAWPQQLQLLPDLEFLLRRAVLQLFDAIAPVVVLALQTGVLLLEPPYLAPFVHQRGDALRAPQRHVSIHAYQNKNDQDSSPADEMMQSQSFSTLTFVYNPVLSKDPVGRANKI
jgi:hypothetical protein